MRCSFTILFKLNNNLLLATNFYKIRIICRYRRPRSKYPVDYLFDFILKPSVIIALNYLSTNPNQYDFS